MDSQEGRDRSEGIGRDPRPRATPFLEVRELSKHYGGTQAIDSVDLSISPGSVCALVGANGAGKSTLVKIISGVEQADSGAVLIDGEETEIHSAAVATKLGIRTMHQEFNLVPKFSVVQNMGLGLSLGDRGGFLDRRRVRRRAAEVLERIKAPVKLDSTIEGLTVSERWMVSLGRLLMEDARFIAMDEPTASFTEAEADRVFDLVRELAADGVAVLYVSHRLEEVIDLSDRIVVMREGKTTNEYERGRIDKQRLTVAIVGREVEHDLATLGRDDDSVTTGETVLTVRGLAREPRVHDASFDVHAGEILGFAGLVGAGRTELARMVAGVDKASAGEMTLLGKPYAPSSPGAAIRAGVSLVPEERRSEGLVLEQSISFNMCLSSPAENFWHAGLPFLSPRKAKSRSTQLIERFSVKASSPEQIVGRLSGGNQQKVLVSRCVATSPKLLILDEPTVGVDIGARHELFLIIRALADEGTAVILISSDFDELTICDRVLVMREGRITAMVARADASKANLTSLCYAEKEYAQ